MPRIPSLAKLIDQDADDALHARLQPLVYTGSIPAQREFFTDVCPGLILRAARAGSGRVLATLVGMVAFQPQPLLPSRTLATLLRHAGQGHALSRLEHGQRQLLLHAFREHPQVLTRADWKAWWECQEWREFLRPIESSAWFKSACTKWAKKPDHYPDVMGALLGNTAESSQTKLRITSVLSLVQDCAPQHTAALAQAWMDAVEAHQSITQGLPGWYRITQETGLPVPDSFWADRMREHMEALRWLSPQVQDIRMWTTHLLDLHESHPLVPPPGFSWDAAQARVYGTKLGTWIARTSPQHTSSLLGRAIFGLEKVLYAWGGLTVDTVQAFDEALQIAPTALEGLRDMRPDDYWEWEALRLRVITDTPTPAAPSRPKRRI